ncbi:MAG: hypothetical protein GWN86_07065 [Desulfobacterales bacterium]|nr:hypothetical protein [Desulfobacterales bacterium]
MTIAGRDYQFEAYREPEIGELFVTCLGVKEASIDDTKHRFLIVTAKLYLSFGGVRFETVGINRPIKQGEWYLNPANSKEPIFAMFTTTGKYTPLRAIGMEEDFA